MNYTRITKPSSLNTEDHYLFININKTVFYLGKYLGTIDHRGFIMFEDYAHEIDFLFSPRRCVVKILLEKDEKYPPLNTEYSPGQDLDRFIRQYNTLRNL